MCNDTEYKCFTRTWWIENPKYPNGLEPCAGERHYVRGTFTEEEAIEKCQEYNDTHEPGRLSLKMEFEEA